MVGLLTSQWERDVAAYLIGLLVSLSLALARARSVSCGATTGAVNVAAVWAQTSEADILSA